MTQEKQWEKEYKDSKFITKHEAPQKFFIRFLKFLKKEKQIEIRGLKILDLGCGVGRHANYLASLGALVTGLEISKTALKIARERAEREKLKVDYRLTDIGGQYDFSKNYFDLVLDITSSNALNEKEREVYLGEVERVLRSGGYFFVRALCKEGDQNAKKMLKLFPGKEVDTYIMPGTNLVEKVFSREDFQRFYSKKFEILKLTKESGYSSFNNQSYKRNFWIAYMQKNNG